MAGELGDRERRYVEAYLELESQSATARAGARERVLAAALAELEPRERAASSRGVPRGSWIAAGLGLCAAAAMLAWWSGRASVVEEHATRVHEQAPRVSEGERTVHEASTASRRGVSASGPAIETTSAAAAEASSEPLRSQPRPSPSTASAKRTDAAGSTRRRTDAGAEPAEPVPTLSDPEVALLERARRLARQGERSAALTVLREHAQSYPQSVLGPERTAEEVAVLCRMGATSAESARASFLEGEPPQYLRSRVEKACAR